MKAFVFGFETPKSDPQITVLVSPAAGFDYQRDYTTPHRWVLTDTDTQRPILGVQQQFKDGHWDFIFGHGWALETLADFTHDTISVYGNWQVRGLQAALNEAKAILNL